MRVAQIMAGAPAGGAELFFERLSIALAGAGEEVLPVIRRNTARAERLRTAGLRPIELGFGGALGLTTRWRLRTVLRRFKARVAVAWMGRAAAAAPRGDWVLVGRLGGTYDLRRFRRCDHLVANTQGLVRWITDQGWPARRVQYLPNFVPDLGQAEPMSRAALGLPASARMVLGLGRLHPDKAFDILIRAMALLAGVHLVVAGEGPEREALAALAERLGLSERVHLLGWREDTGGLLRRADALVCASRLEPLGNVIIEGWAARRPVIAAAAAGPRELIRIGEDGMLVPIDDPFAIAEAIRCVLEDQGRASALAVAGRVRYETEFSEQPVLARWREFLAHVEKP
ncbi:MAG: glycosyltransferase [Acetobacteraceae bacterium]|nr:glycosyltransferase [Acetobacteraceae bacterium]